MKQNYLSPSLKHFLELNDDARINHIEKDLWIGYPRAQQGLGKLHHLLLHPKRTRMPNLLICVGTKEAYLAIRSDPQLENRFEPFALPLWRPGSNFEALLASFVSVLPLNLNVRLFDKKLVFRSIFYFC